MVYQKAGLTLWDSIEKVNLCVGNWAELGNVWTCELSEWSLRAAVLFFAFKGIVRVLAVNFWPSGFNHFWLCWYPFPGSCHLFYIVRFWGPCVCLGDGELRRWRRCSHVGWAGRNWSHGIGRARRNRRSWFISNPFVLRLHRPMVANLCFYFEKSWTPDPLPRASHLLPPFKRIPSRQGCWGW